MCHRNIKAIDKTQKHGLKNTGLFAWYLKMTKPPGIGSSFLGQSLRVRALEQSKFGYRHAFGW
jgi:hypothetical protein